MIAEDSASFFQFVLFDLKYKNATDYEKFISTNSMLSDPFPSILLYTTSSKSPFSSCSDPLVLLAPNLVLHNEAE